MTTTTTTTRAPETRTAQQELPELPALTTGDRLAVAIGAQLILWSERHRRRRADHALRADRASVARAEAAASTRGAFEQRAWAGPTW